MYFHIFRSNARTLLFTVNRELDPTEEHQLFIHIRRNVLGILIFRPNNVSFNDLKEQMFQGPPNDIKLIFLED